MINDHIHQATNISFCSILIGGGGREGEGGRKREIEEERERECVCVCVCVYKTIFNLSMKNMNTLSN